MKFLYLLLGAALLFVPINQTFAYRSKGTHHYTTKSYKYKYPRASRSSSGRKKASGVARDKHGKIKRSSSAKNTFKKKQPCPSTRKSKGSCPGYVIDHKIPLKKGGADSPSNMQWQTKEAAKAKDKWE